MFQIGCYQPCSVFLHADHLEHEYGVGFLMLYTSMGSGLDRVFMSFVLDCYFHSHDKL